MIHTMLELGRNAIFGDAFNVSISMPREGISIVNITRVSDRALIYTLTISPAVAPFTFRVGAMLDDVSSAAESTFSKDK